MLLRKSWSPCWCVFVWCVHLWFLLLLFCYIIFFHQRHLCINYLFYATIPWIMFFEHNISANYGLLGDRVIQFVSFWFLIINSKYKIFTFNIQFSSSLFRYMCISYTSKYYEMRYAARHTWPCLFWYPVHHTLCRRYVDHLNSTCSCFFPKLIRQVFTFQHASCHVHNFPDLFLHYTILQWCVPGCKLSYDSMMFALIMQCLWVIFSTMIWPQYLVFRSLCFSTKALNSLNFAKVSDFYFKK